MILLVSVILVFVYAALSHKLQGKKIEDLEKRLFLLEEEKHKEKDITTAETVANAEGVDVNN